jgi:transposase
VLGLVIDERGFVKRHQIFAGNTSDVSTLARVVRELKVRYLADRNNIVVIDRGIASKKNIEFLKKEGYRYICVERGRSLKGRMIEKGVRGKMRLVFEDESKNIKLYREEKEGELYILAESEGRRKKEEAIRKRFEGEYEEALKKLAERVGRGRVKDAVRVERAIGALACRYRRVARLYQVKLIKEGGQLKVRWRKEKKRELKGKEEEGVYLLRSNACELADEQVWKLYNLLTRVERIFRYLKSGLRIGPLYHRRADRAEAHIFVVVLAYHVVNVAEMLLGRNGERREFLTVKKELSTQMRVTMKARTEQGEVVYVRQTTVPDQWQREIYRKLGLKVNPLPRVVFRPQEKRVLM